jgi:hypothetical protein
MFPSKQRKSIAKRKEIYRIEKKRIKAEMKNY